MSDTTQAYHDMPSTKPDEYVGVGLGGLLAASQYALSMNRGLAQPHTRDAQTFKRLKRTDELMAERILIDTGKVQRKLLRHLARARNLTPMHPGILSPLTEGHLIGNQLSSPSEEINPIDLLNQSRRVTQMGPGGIGDADRITSEMQAVHPSIFGFISPIEGPESEKAGVDVRLANGVKLGSNGRLYQKFRNRRDGHDYWLAPEDLQGKVIGLPGEDA